MRFLFAKDDRTMNDPSDYRWMAPSAILNLQYRANAWMR
jgi:hypothetical protein